MAQLLKVKFIFHCKFNHGDEYIKLNNTIKKIEGNEIQYEFSNIKFTPLQYYHPTKFYILNSFKQKLKDYNLNLIKGTNNYHIISCAIPAFFELIFYKEENLKIFIRNEEIKEYDECFNFKRYSLIGVDHHDITIKETKIKLYIFIPFNQKGFSYQLSFYDIKNKITAFKKIKPKINIRKKFKKFYTEYLYYLINISEEINTLKKNKNNFEERMGDVCESFKNNFINIIKDLKLILVKGKTILKKILCNEEYLNFFYMFVKTRILFHYYKCNNKDINNFIKLYDYLDGIYSQLKEENDLTFFEKLIIIFNLGLIFLKFKSCDNYLKANIHYIKIDKVEKNSIMDLSMQFITNYINNLTEDSPSFFKLVELNSGTGYYYDKKVYTYDMIPLSVLKNNLKESIPSIITFYNKNKINNISSTDNIVGGVCINEKEIFGDYEKIKVDKYYQDEKLNMIKDISMNLAIDIIQKCFGIKKFNININSIGCCNIKKIKKFNMVNDTSNNNKNALKVLSLIKHRGNLIDHPELFYNKENLQKLENYVFYKYKYENENEINKKDNNAFESKEEDDIKTVNFEQEIDYLIKYFSNKNLEISLDKIIQDLSYKNAQRGDKFLGRKRKNNNKSDTSWMYNRKQLSKILSNRNISKELWNYYLDLYQKLKVYD